MNCSCVEADTRGTRVLPYSQLGILRGTWACWHCVYLGSATSHGRCLASYPQCAVATGRGWITAAGSVCGWVLWREGQHHQDEGLLSQSQHETAGAFGHWSGYLVGWNHDSKCRFSIKMGCLRPFRMDWCFLDSSFHSANSLKKMDKTLGWFYSIKILDALFSPDTARYLLVEAPAEGRKEPVWGPAEFLWDARNGFLDWCAGLVGWMAHAVSWQLRWLFQRDDWLGKVMESGNVTVTTICFLVSFWIDLDQRRCHYFWDKSSRTAAELRRILIVKPIIKPSASETDDRN